MVVHIERFFFEARDFYGFGAISLGTVILLTSAFFPEIYQTTVKNDSLEWVQHPFESEQFFSCFEVSWEIYQCE